MVPFNSKRARYIYASIYYVESAYVVLVDLYNSTPSSSTVVKAYLLHNTCGQCDAIGLILMLCQNEIKDHIIMYTYVTSILHPAATKNRDPLDFTLIKLSILSSNTFPGDER